MSTIDFEQSILTVAIDSTAIDRNWGLSATKAHLKSRCGFNLAFLLHLLLNDLIVLLVLDLLSKLLIL